MRAIATAVLESVRGDPAVLEDVRFRADIDDLLAEVAVEQRYHNPTAVNIEANYTFPLPLDAVLLSFEVEIGERRLAGRIIEKSSAERVYEEAITDGDAAILLEQAEPGLFTASIGNLLPGQSATIRFCYALLLRWNGDRVRFMLPTTIAPRYGDPAHLAPHQVPEHAFEAERSFALEVGVRGLLAGARFSSPSHPVSVSQNADVTTVSIEGQPPMDRDFVLEAQSASARPAGAIASRDIEGWVVLASFRPEIPTAEPHEPRSIKIVIDCSGSMGGDSIAQARLGLAKILDGLRTGDLFDIVAFGSHQQALFGCEVPVSEASIARARRFARSLDATMGGTEMGQALQAAYAIKGGGGLSRDVLLITDGETWASECIIAEARASGYRIFSVGVGSSVAEGLVRGLAEATGGACELVAPREDMANRIDRHFQRMYAQRARQVKIVWPAAPTRQLPETFDTVFDGDTVHVCGWFPERPFGQVDLAVTLPDGSTMVQDAAIRVLDEPMAADGPAAPTLARLAAARRLALAGPEELARLALSYQLVSPATSCVVVDMRPGDEKAEDLPRVIMVRQVVAAGWHGVGSVDAAPSDVRLKRGSRMQRHSARDIFPDASTAFAAKRLPGTPSEDENRARLLAAFRRSRASRAQKTRSTRTDDWLAAFIAQLNEWDVSTVPDLFELERWGLPDEIAEALWELVDDGNDEEAVVISFLYQLISHVDASSLDRKVRRSATWRFKRLKHQVVIPAHVISAAGA